jgi:hypothetical protein
MLRTHLRRHASELILRQNFCATDKQVNEWKQIASRLGLNFSLFVRQACERFVAEVQEDDEEA